MEGYIQIKRSQVNHYIKTPLFIKNGAGTFVLYKAKNTKVDSNLQLHESLPPLYIFASMTQSARKELQTQLKSKLKDRIESGNLKEIKSTLCEIVHEALQDTESNGIEELPDTIEILYSECAQTKNLLQNFRNTSSDESALIEHSVDVMVLTLNYCLFCNLSESESKRLSLGALLHDVGLTRIPKTIYGVDRQLTDQEFEIFKTHAAIGHDIIKNSHGIDASVASGVLEHHERLDGSGYPRGIASLSFEGRLFGLIDCFEHLTRSERAHRKRKNPYQAMQTIQNEALKESKFDKKIFRDFCLSLSGKQTF